MRKPTSIRWRTLQLLRRYARQHADGGRSEMVTEAIGRGAPMRIKRIVYSLVSLAVLAFAVGAGWRP